MGVPAVIERAIDDTMPMLANILAATPGIPALSFKAGLLSQMMNPKTAAKLAQCSLPSILNCAATFAGLGIMPDGVSQQAFMLPFNDKAAGGMVATPCVGTMGYVTLAEYAGRTLKGTVVRDGDEFDWMEGTEEWVKHKKTGKHDARIIYAWAKLSAPDRSDVITVIPIEELIEIMNRSAAVKFGGDTPYNDLKIGRPAMFEKTAKRRLKRSIPLIKGGRRFLTADHIEGQFDATSHPHYLIPANDGQLHVTNGVTGERTDLKEPPANQADPTAPAPTFYAYINSPTKMDEFSSLAEWKMSMMRMISLITKNKGRLEGFRTANAEIMASMSGIDDEAAAAAMDISKAITKAIEALK